jgi:hypothetical protein
MYRNNQRPPMHVAVPRFLLTLGMAILPACALSPTGSSAEEAPVQILGARSAESRSQRVSDQELRFRLQRFSDYYTALMWEPLDAIIESDLGLVPRREALEAKYSFGSNAMLIASSPFPAVAVLDMVVFVSLTRAMLERAAPEIVGEEAAAAVVVGARLAEEEAWVLAATLLTPAQQDELRSFIDEWLRRHPDLTYVEAVRFGDFVGELGGGSQKRAGGLLSQVRRATQAADEALELADRLNFFFQRAPLLWRMHAQLAYFEIVSQPEIQQALADTGRLSASADRVARSAETLTNILVLGPTPENEAFFASLDVGEQRLRGLIAESRETLATANALATTVDGLAVRLNLDAPPDPDAEPMDIPALFDVAGNFTAELGGVAGNFSETAIELRSLVESLDALLSSPAVAQHIPAAVDTAEGRTRELVRYVVLLTAGVVLASVLATLVAMLGYRYLAARLERRAAV